MKRIVLLFLLVTVILSGCGIIPKVITSSPGTAPTTVEVVETAAPLNTAVPTIPPATAPTQAPTPTSTPVIPIGGPAILAYVAADGNITLKDLETGSETRVTEDAAKIMSGGDQTVEYYDLAWASTGEYLAAQRVLGKTVTSGMQFTFSLIVLDMATMEVRDVLTDVLTAGFAWRPYTHQLTYALVTDDNYFTSRAELDASKARGIWSIDVDAGSAPVEIVPPSAGFSLVTPQWSPDGRIISFAEIFAMEGSGNFAYYDTETGEYVRREQAVGGYDLLPDGSGLVYDTLTYMPSGMERIWIVNLDWSGAQRISPHYAEGYAFMPRLSPFGDQVAYFKGIGDPGVPMLDRSELFVQPLVETNDPRSLGVVVFPVSMDWLPDGEGLILSVGQSDAREIITIRLSDAHVEKLAEGTYPALRP